MKIIADANIPFVNQLFKENGSVILLPSAAITASAIQMADLFLGRTVTKVDESLLFNSLVKFVGSASAGVDHIDTAWLEQQGVAWAHAPGANAEAVADYVLCCIASLQRAQILPKSGLKVGVIGVGHVGSQVARLLESLGCEVMLNDPPRAAMDPTFRSTPLAEFRNLDMVCVHTPLTHDSAFPTYHLINQDFLAQLKPGCVLLNAGRGAVVDSEALLKAKHVVACLDVWENEPDISLDLVRHAFIATPHIAGYSISAKKRATEMLWQQAATYFGWNFKAENLFSTNLSKLGKDWAEQALAIYDPLAHTQEVKRALIQTKEIANAFQQLRNNYPLREQLSESSLIYSTPF